MINQFKNRCTVCKKMVMVTIGHIGHNVDCPYCRKQFFIPDPLVVPFNENQLQAVIQNETPQLVQYINALPRQGNWTAAVLAAWIESKLYANLIYNDYEKTVSQSRFTSTVSKAELAIKKTEYLDIITKFANNISPHYEKAVVKHELEPMVSIVVAVQDMLVEVDYFFESLSAETFSQKEPYPHIQALMFHWKSELEYQLRNLVNVLRRHSAMDKASTKFVTPQFSIIPASLFQIDELLASAR